MYSWSKWNLNMISPFWPTNNAEKWSRPFFLKSLHARNHFLSNLLHKREDFTNSVTRITFFTLPFFRGQLKNIDCKSLLRAVCTQFIEKSSRCITWDMSVQDVWKDEIFDLTSLLLLLHTQLGQLFSEVAYIKF